MIRLREVLGDKDFPYALRCEECEHRWMAAFEDDECPDCTSEDVTVDDGFASEETRDAYMEGVLEITPFYIVYRVGLSWRGPADGFYLYVDPEDKTIDKIEYYFQDWFDGATRVLVGDEFDMVRDMFESYIEIVEYERTHK